jgi:hypothetical protein
MVHSIRDSDLGLVCSGSVLDEAKRWFELSTVMCRFVPDGQSRAEKVRPYTLSSCVPLIGSYREQISETYTKLLSRLSV